VEVTPSPQERPYGGSEAERARATLSLGILVLRWATVAWTAVLAAATLSELRHPAVAWVVVAAEAAWTAWLTAARPAWSSPVLAADLALAVVLLALAGYANEPGRLAAGDRPVFSTAYPVVAALTWGACRGVRGGLAAGATLGLALLAARVLNGAGPEELRTAQALGLASGAVNFLLAGFGVGLLARLLDRSAAQLRVALDESVRARERAARLAERESLARQIHDSVLQSLAMVHKRGRELAAAEQVPGSELVGLAELAAGQERALRMLVLRPPGQPPQGRAALRDALEELAAATPGLRVTVSAVGPLWLPGGHVAELRAAVRQALDNVAGHAGTGAASVFAEQDGAEVVVSVRDDGAGFAYDEAALAAAGKMGLLWSVKGRVEQLGGTMRVDSTPGRGTEVELRVPVPGEVADRG